MLNVSYEAMLENLFEGVYVVDHDRRITYWNRRAEEITGFTKDEIVGISCVDGLLRHADQNGEILCLRGCPLHDGLAGGTSQAPLVYLHHKDGHRIPVSLRVSPLKDSSGIVVGAVEMFQRAGSDQIQQERIAVLEEMAYVDTLTGLPNRRFLESKIQSRLNELRRYDWPFGVLFMDIDRFKDVNDTYGHDVGDQVLKMVAETVMSTTRSADVVGRYGGEEFMVVVSNIAESKLLEIAERFRVLVSLSSLRDPAGLGVTISIGAAMAVPADTAEALLKRADGKLYDAKHAGRNSTIS